MQKTLAMILAGGRGKRMDILCHDRPKPVLRFAGKFRVIDFTLSNCVHSRINQVAVLADYHRYAMASYLERWSAMNGTSRSLHILEPPAGSYRGTADAVYQNLGYLRRYHAERVLVLAGDHIYKMDYRKMLAFHERTKADVTIGVVQVPIEEAHRFGAVTVDRTDRVVDFVEKSGIPRKSLASMGMYIFNTEVLTRRLIEDAAQPDSPHDFGYAVIPAMVRTDRVYAFKFDGYWQDIGTVEAYYSANMELTGEKPPFEFGGAWPVLGEAHGPTAPEVSRSGSIINSIVGPGCVIKGRVENSILSPGVLVDEQAVIMNSIVMSGASVGYHSVVDHCVLDEEAKVGRLCYIGFRGGMLPGNPSVTVLGRGATVPSHTAIGSNCRVLPGVTQADFNANMVPSGTVISPRAADKAILVEEKVPVQ